MPRVVKPKPPAAGPAAKKPKQKNKLYEMPEKIAEGTVLTDLSKGQWRIGPSIGVGGFGEIYSACRVGDKTFDYVVKCEPHGNGPLFVEMHFYMRNAKLEDIQRFQRDHGLKSLGMPYMLGNGSADINGQKHRFIVMPRYGCDVAKHFKENGNRLPEGTAYRLAIQMLDVYEFVHSCGYVHADLKAANILIGSGKGGAAQAYLVDYGLASHITTKEFKPDPKKMHNGTIEYTSRDAHQGVATMRADLEILGYNLIEWLGIKLPWVKENLLAIPVAVQKAKERFMADISGQLKKLFQNGVPAPIADYMKYVAKMTYNEKPDYEKCRNIFKNALKLIKVPNSGDLNFKIGASSKNNNSYSNEPTTSKAATKPWKKFNLSPKPSDVFYSSDDDDDAFEPRKIEKSSPMKKQKTTGAANTVKTPMKRSRTPSVSPRKRISTTPHSPPEEKYKPHSTKPSTPAPAPPTRKKQASPRSNSTPVASAKINFSPAISVSRPGKTIINDNLTPNVRSNKTYEFNFELDVSMDANVIVNVKRKKKAAKEDSLRQTPKRQKSAVLNGSTNTGDGDTPVTRVKVRKIASNDDSSSSPRTPAVTVKKSKR